MEKHELKEAIAEAIRANHRCEKEEEIAELEATCHRIGDFTGEMRDTNTKLGLALEKLAVGDERLKTIGMMLDRNERTHDEFGKRLSNLGKIVEHDHAPIIAGVRGAAKIAKAIAITLIATIIIATSAFMLGEWAEHKAQLQSHTTTGRP